MKTMYFVARTYGNMFEPTIVESTASFEDAVAYINILKNKGKNGEYIILKVTGE